MTKCLVKVTVLWRGITSDDSQTRVVGSEYMSTHIIWHGTNCIRSIKPERRTEVVP